MHVIFAHALPMTNEPNISVEKVYTLRDAAEMLGVPYYKVQRAARTGLIPTYRLLNSRPYVKISDILKLMQEESDMTRRP